MPLSPGSTPKRRAGLSLTLTRSYSAFLLVCLALGAVLYLSSTRSARENFWEQQALSFERSIAAMDDDLAAMDSYTRQLLIDSTFIRFAGMKGLEEKGFVYTASEVMRTLSSRLYSLTALPVEESHIYLKESGYVISASQFTEARQFYKGWRNYDAALFDEWLSQLTGAAGVSACIDVSRFSGVPGDYVLLRDVNAIMNRRVPAVIWFELDTDALRARFLPSGVPSAVVVENDGGSRQMLLASDDASAALAGALDALSLDGRGFGRAEDRVVIRRPGRRLGWVYTLVLPAGLCDAALGNYDAAFLCMMLLALLFGGVMIWLMVRRSMRPVQQLSSRLSEAEGDNARLQRELDSQRPALETSYLRMLLSGHVTSSDEFEYMLRYLGLRDGQQFYVLYCVAHRQDGAGGEAADLLADVLSRGLHNGHPVYHYATMSGSFIVLVTYDADVPDPLMDLQHRVLTLHDELAQKHSLWLYAGVGMRCTQARSLWESYEQARLAAGFTARGHIFLPYEFIAKESENCYYPVEISAKLQHFITTGNKEQAAEMFALLRRENFEERSLTLAMQSFLLSDIKNTLLKARYQVSRAEAERFPGLDAQLSGAETLPQLEACAVRLCDCFTRTVDPADPIADVRKYLESNFTDPSMCLTKLSDQFHISESYLSHLFKDKTGQNVSVYLETLRLSEAQRRLGQPECNLSALYAELGYNNPATFRRAFKKRYGITPSEMKAKEAPVSC